MLLLEPALNTASLPPGITIVTVYTLSARHVSALLLLLGCSISLFGELARSTVRRANRASIKYTMIGLARRDRVLGVGELTRTDAKFLRFREFRMEGSL
jgi:hypothetical protein